jgi:hypothetical protein
MVRIVTVDDKGLLAREGCALDTRNDLEVSWHTLLADRTPGEHPDASPP